MMAAFPETWRTPRVEEMVDTVVTYILTAGYQALPSGYGDGRDDSLLSPRYYVLGWNADLPGFDGPLERPGRQYFVLSLEMMAAFLRAREHLWFRKSLALLDEHSTDRGTWLLPRDWLVEKQAGYWVAGAHMGLEENRRSRAAVERESTLRVLRLLTRLERLPLR